MINIDNIFVEAWIKLEPILTFFLIKIIIFFFGFKSEFASLGRTLRISDLSEPIPTRFAPFIRAPLNPIGFRRSTAAAATPLPSPPENDAGDGGRCPG